MRSWPTAIASTSAEQAAPANLLLPPGVVPVRHSEGSKTKFAGLEGSNRRSPLQDEVDGGLTLTFPCFSSLLLSSYSGFWVILILCPFFKGSLFT